MWRPGVRLPEVLQLRAAAIRQKNPDMPILVQSAQADQETSLESLGVKFVNKYSRTLLQVVREFMKTNFGFGDFIFRTPDGEEITIRHLYPGAVAGEMAALDGQARSATCQTTAILSYLNHSENVMGTSRYLASRSGRFGPFLDSDGTGPIMPDVD